MEVGSAWHKSVWVSCPLLANDSCTTRRQLRSSAFSFQSIFRILMALGQVCYLDLAQTLFLAQLSASLLGWTQVGAALPMPRTTTSLCI
ncbi:hypothetical protein Peur_069627 [Populus x canadensis]